MPAVREQWRPEGRMKVMSVAPRRVATGRKLNAFWPPADLRALSRRARRYSKGVNDSPRIVAMARSQPQRCYHQLSRRRTGSTSSDSLASLYLAP